MSTGPSRETVKEVITRISNACWNFRKPETKEDLEVLVDTWEQALAGYMYPSFVYKEAVSSWLAQASSGDSPPYPGDILRHCRLVIERIESDPVRGPKLLEWREARRRERDRRMGLN